MFWTFQFEKNSRRLWRSRRRKSSSVPEGEANFPAAVFLAGKCPNLGRDSISCCRKIGEEFSSSVEICPKTFPAAWNLAAKLPNADLNFVVDFCGGFFPPAFFQGKKARKKSTKKIPRKIHAELCVRKTSPRISAEV